MKNIYSFKKVTIEYSHERLNREVLSDHICDIIKQNEKNKGENTKNGTQNEKASTNITNTAPPTNKPRELFPKILRSSFSKKLIKFPIKQIG